MDIIISEKNLDRHTISKYSFKVLSSLDNETATISNEQNVEKESSEPINVVNISDEQPIQEQQPKDEVVQSLLKKTDELSGNYIKLQMKLEAKDEEFKKQLEEEKQKAYEEGVEAGKSQMSEQQNEQLKSSIEQFATSIETISKTEKELKAALDPLRDELVSVAVDIAKEVVVAELSSSSKEVATALAHQLLEEVKGSTSVTLRVNPKDFEHVKGQIDNIEGIKIEPDSALTAGGVVVISDVGNIEGDIMRRYERVKTAALSSE